MENNILQTELSSLLKERFSISKSTRANYARGEDAYEAVLSQAVVFPETNEEVSKYYYYVISIKFPLFLLEQEHL